MPLISSCPSNLLGTWPPVSCQSMLSVQHVSGKHVKGMRTMCPWDRRLCSKITTSKIDLHRKYGDERLNYQHAAPTGHQKWNEENDDGMQTTSKYLLTEETRVPRCRWRYFCSRRHFRERLTARRHNRWQWLTSATQASYMRVVVLSVKPSELCKLLNYTNIPAIFNP